MKRYLFELAEHEPNEDPDVTIGIRAKNSKQAQKVLANIVNSMTYIYYRPVNSKEWHVIK